MNVNFCTSLHDENVARNVNFLMIYLPEKSNFHLLALHNRNVLSQNFQISPGFQPFHNFLILLQKFASKVCFCFDFLKARAFHILRASGRTFCKQNKINFFDKKLIPISQIFYFFCRNRINLLQKFVFVLIFWRRVRFTFAGERKERKNVL